MIDTVNAWSMQTIIPDLTIFVRVPVEVALERCNKRGILSAYEKKDFLQKVANGFEDLYKNRTNVIIVNGTSSQKNMRREVCDAIQKWITTNIT
jgi:thymidylate kinase